jgi:hypothetical protein
MKNSVLVTASVAPKKSWIAPELKKLNIDDITAGGVGPGGDAFTLAS